MKHLTVRGVSRDLAKALRAERQRRRASLNRTVLDLLRAGLGLDPERPKENGLRKLAGTWSVRELRAFESAVAAFAAPDRELWS